MPLSTLGINPEDLIDPITHQPAGLEPIPTGIEKFDAMPSEVYQDLPVAGSAPVEAAPVEVVEEKPKKIKKWADHKEADYFKNLPADEQENFRRQYFEYRVAPVSYTHLTLPTILLV